MMHLNAQKRTPVTNDKLNANHQNKPPITKISTDRKNQLWCKG